MPDNLWNVGAIGHWVRHASEDVTLEIHAMPHCHLVSIRDQNVVVKSKEVTGGLFPALIAAEKLGAVYLGIEGIV